MPRGKPRSRHELTLAVVAKKERIFGKGDRKFSPQRSARNVAYGIGGKEPSLALLRWAANATDAEIMRAVGNRDSDYAFLFYK